MFSSSAFARQVDIVASSSIDASGREALAAAASLAALTGDLVDRDTPAALRAWLSDHAAAYGFRGARYLHLGHLALGSKPRGWKLLRFLSTHADQADLWVDENEHTEAILVTFLPFAWSIEAAPAFGEAQCRWYAEQQLATQPAGVTVPVQDHLAGPACLILFGGTLAHAEQVVDESTPALVVQALSFHLAAKAVLPPAHRFEGTLSDREIACLRLAALGDTLAETAERLRISARTVELHVARASRKLNATNKVHAVALAIGAGLIRI